MLNIITTALSFSCATTCLFLGIIVIMKRKKDAVSVLFCLMISTGILFYLLYPYAWFTNYAHFRIAYSFKVSLLILTESIMLHFYVELTGLMRNKIHKCLLYVPAIFVTAGIFLLTDSYPHFEWINGRWTHLYNDISVWDVIFPISYYSLPLMCTFMVFIWHKKSGLKKDRLVGKTIIYSLIISSTLAFIVDFVLKTMGSKIPTSGMFFYLIHIICLLYCLTRYHFLTFNISSITEEVLSHINNHIAVIGPDRRIIHVNAQMTQTMHIREGMNFSGIFISDDLIDDKMELLTQGGIQSFEEKVRVNTSRGIMHAFTYACRLTDSVGDFTGILIIIKEQPGVKDFTKLYGISEREYQVIDLILKGFNREEVSDLINLKPRTVESHLRNIYDKINVKNRVELMKIARKFDLV